MAEDGLAQVPRPPDRESSQQSTERAGLEQKAFFNEQSRIERLREIFAWCVYAISILIALVIFTIILAVAWHYLAPSEWAWLSSKQLSAVRVFLFSGTITGLAGFLATYVRNRI